MPIFNVHFTYSVFKRNPDDSQQKIERPIGSRQGVVADNISAAIAIAARDIPVEQFDDETLSTAVVTAVQVK